MIGKIYVSYNFFLSSNLSIHLSIGNAHTHLHIYNIHSYTDTHTHPHQDNVSILLQLIGLLDRHELQV